jgi:hypothetical protein
VAAGVSGSRQRHAELHALRVAAEGRHGGAAEGPGDAGAGVGKSKREEGASGLASPDSPSLASAPAAAPLHRLRPAAPASRAARLPPTRPSPALRRTHPAAPPQAPPARRNASRSRLRQAGVRQPAALADTSPSGVRLARLAHAAPRAAPPRAERNQAKTKGVAPSSGRFVRRKAHPEEPPANQVRVQYHLQQAHPLTTPRARQHIQAKGLRQQGCPVHPASPAPRRSLGCLLCFSCGGLRCRVSRRKDRRQRGGSTVHATGWRPGRARRTQGDHLRTPGVVRSKHAVKANQVVVRRRD